jgi:hypothetical protein
MAEANEFSGDYGKLGSESGRSLRPRGVAGNGSPRSTGRSVSPNHIERSSSQRITFAETETRTDTHDGFRSSVVFGEWNVPVAS